MSSSDTRASERSTGVAQGTGRSFGTFGELLQGTVHSGQHFMVTCPVAAWNTASFRYAPGSTSVDVHPVHKWKAGRLAMSALRFAGVGGGGQLILHGELPEGKGLASSSADLVATARAVAAAVGTRFRAEDIESLMREIEPSDGVMYDEIVDFDHRNVRVRERLGTLPSMIIVAHDEGGQVDTVQYNGAARVHTDEERREYARLRTALGTAIHAGDLPEVGRVATRSAELNARLNPRRFLAELRRLSGKIGALGVVCAHSGTVLGILIDHADPDAAAKTEAALAGCAALPGTTAVYRSLGHEDDDWSRLGALHLTHHQRM